MIVSVFASSLLATLTLALGTPDSATIQARQVQALSPYAPVPASCPTTPLVRRAQGISSSEAAYIAHRKPLAAQALAAWLKTTGAAFAAPKTYPTLAITTSGGGLRSLLCGAGVIQAFDARDSSLSTSGLYQAMTYQGGLSGGAWLLSSLAANNWPTVSSLKTGLWEQAFEDSLLLPDNLFASTAYQEVTDDLLAKQAAGFPPTLTDAWGRLLAYQLLYGADGGVSDRVSGLTSLSNFTSSQVPLPIFTALGVDTADGQCLPGPNATQYEFTPYEFGSWDDGIAAFTQIQYLGSSLTNGAPTVPGKCVTGYDNQGYVLGTSSSLFNEGCASSPSDDTLPSAALTSALEGLVTKAHAASTRDEYAAYPNPFYNLATSPRVAGQAELDLVDGGEALQNNPIWPFLHRSIDALIVNDNSADTSDNFPNGSEILTTYVQAQRAGLARMPVIPSVETFVAQGLNKRPTFFGCYNASQMTIVYMPNVNYTFMSNEPTAKLEYLPSETDAMIANGNLIGNFDNNATWATCLGCALMKKTGAKLPARCTSCFSYFCN